jgi:hypothetical protein
MEIYGKIFSEPILRDIREMISTQPDISRLELSRKLCERMEWRSPNGKLQDMSCRKALLELERRGLLQLPKREQHYGFEKKRHRHIEYKLAVAQGSLSELGEVLIEPIKSRYSKDSQVWFQLIESYHYLGHARLCGAQIRYIVKSEKYDYIGALAFSSATYKLRVRDEYIGWGERARRENIQYVISNDRFLIVPTVSVKNLASWVLSRVLQRLPADWEQRYGIRPLLVETYVDPSRYRGTCYQAANWQYVGETSGRRDGIAKKVFLYPLQRRWRELLCRESPDALGSGELVADCSNWAEAEFGSARLYDNRLKQRLYVIAQDFYNKPQANIPEACGSKARSIAAYRFFQNEKVTMEVILEAHTEATIERIKRHRIVLAPQDTTALDYSTHPMTEGLGPISTSGSETIGLILHDTLAFSEEGIPLGILDAQCWARDPEESGKRYRRKELPIEQKESMKWLRSYRRVAEIQKLCPQSLLVSIGDRESDIYDLFQEALKVPQNPGLLVRAEKSRNRKVEQESLWKYMLRREVAGHLQIHVPRRGNRKARDAEVELRYAPVELKPPKRLASSESINIWAVYIKEIDPAPDVKNPIEWMLLTTVAVRSLEDALQRVRWYSRRWGIETFHRTLKSGCRIKDRQLGGADRLEVALAVDMVVAWRIYHMSMLGREIPDAPCNVFFREEEWKALFCYVNKTPVAPRQPPSLREAIRMVGRIGGHLGRKSDGEPGTQTLWRGLQRLDTATEMYMLFNPPRAGP